MVTPPQPARPPPSRAATHGVLFDIGYGLLDERPRLEAALRWLSDSLGRQGLSTSAARLGELYAAACLDPAPGGGSVLVQTAVAAGASAEVAARERRELPWDAVAMPPLPGALEGLRALREAGLLVGVLANQPGSAKRDLERCGAAALLDDIWLSEAVGLAKPDPAFFRLALTRWGLAPERVAYVGDRPDNDVAPSRALGLHAVRLLVGPHARQPVRGEAQRADYEAASLAAAARHLLAWAGG